MSHPLLVPVLLAGGSGTRLWPVSRDTMPKQFLPLIGHHSTYQQALLRVIDANMFGPPLVMTASDFRFFARRQAEELGIATTVVLEPERRDSGPAIAAAAVLARQRDPQAIVLTLAADHVILDADLFAAACRAGREVAAAGHIVTFGLPPSEPRTSYGYIRPGASLGAAGVHAVAAFVENPIRPRRPATSPRISLELGHFLFRAADLLAELRRFEPPRGGGRSRGRQATTDLGFLRLAPDAFATAPKSPSTMPSWRRPIAPPRWKGAAGPISAVGTPSMPWPARRRSGNALHGPAVAHDARNCLVHAEDRLTAVVGLDDAVVVTTPDAVLVLPRARAEAVKDIVAELKTRGFPEASQHRRVHRPWGHYEGVDAGERFQVKRIVVLPGAKLSLQRHMHRAEHWVVVCGTAAVTIGEEHKTVHENESIYIPMGTVHRLANPGKIALELIEVQTGSYLGEDDIVRLDDVYGRG